MRVNAAPWRWNACCIKTAGTLNLLRNMVEKEKDKVLYICLSSFLGPNAETIMLIIAG